MPTMPKFPSANIWEEEEEEIEDEDDDEVVAVEILTEPPSGLGAPPGRYYGPCSGRDVAIAFQLFGDTIRHFTFCDLHMRRNTMTAEEAVPVDWVYIGKSRLRYPEPIDESQTENRGLYPGRRVRRHTVLEVWQRPDGAEVIVEFREGRAETVLTEQIAPGSLSAFLHVMDGAGEGGSNLWFLQTPERPGVAVQKHGGLALLPQVADRLCDGAFVVTSGSLADLEFRMDKPFVRAGWRWEPVCVFQYRVAQHVWRVTRP